MTFTHVLAKQFNEKFSGKAFLRPTTFIPTHHKHQDNVCQGWQLHISDITNYHTIFGTLYIMRSIREQKPTLDFWLSVNYEFDSPYSPAQSLIGDDLLIDYMNGVELEATILKHFNRNETNWKELIETIK